MARVGYSRSGEGNREASYRMPTITLYVKETDLELVEKGKKRLGDSLSSVFIDCVRRQLEELNPSRAKELKKITLEVGDPPMKKSFMGTWIVGGPNGGITTEAGDSGV